MLRGRPRRTNMEKRGRWPGVVRTTSGLNLEPLAVHPADPQRVYARGCDGPYRSTDGGDSWTRQGDDLFLTYDVRSIAPAAADDWQTVYLGCATEGGGGGIVGSQAGGSKFRYPPPQERDVPVTQPQRPAQDGHLLLEPPQRLVAVDVLFEPGQEPIGKDDVDGRVAHRVGESIESHV